MEGEKGIVCVTGGTGYIASWLIMKLLQQGYSVRATVRSNPECKKDTSYLTTLPGASEKLKIFNADLNKPDSFNPAIAGCVAVFHLAHPIDLDGKEPDDIVNKRAVEGTLGILRACADSKTVKRVVYTSSAAAVVFNNKGLDIMDENTWTDIDYCRTHKVFGSSYAVSKMLTEKAALVFAEQHGLDLVTLILPLVVGRFICSNPPGSVYMALALIFGKQDQYKHLTKAHMVHVEDVTSAHIFLLECPNAKGRYICSSVEITIHEMAAFFSSKYPEFQMPNLESSSREYNYKGYKPFHLSSKKLLDLGFKFKNGVDEMYDDAIHCCKEKGFL